MKVSSAYTRLLVSDLEACFLFYKDVMEFEVKQEDIEDGYAEFVIGNMRRAFISQARNGKNNS